MPTFEKRPDVVEAERWDGSLEGAQIIAKMLRGPWKRGCLQVISDISVDFAPASKLRLNLGNPERKDMVYPGDWVVQGLYCEIRGIHILNDGEFNRYYAPKEDT